MNKANLKSYAPKARLDFIKAVTERANVLGISTAGAVPAEVRGDVALIDGREWPAKVAGQRDELIARIKRHGFEQTMDEVAYTWFNSSTPEKTERFLQAGNLTVAAWAGRLFS